MKAKQIILKVLIAVLVGLCLTINPYVYNFALPLVIIISIILIAKIITGILKKEMAWKNNVAALILCWVAITTGFITYRYLQYRNAQNRNSIIKSIYKYKSVTQKFPSSIDQLNLKIKQRGNYIPDSDLKSFKFYWRNLYGFPETFSSSDSTWKR